MHSSELKIGQKYLSGSAKYIGIGLWNGNGVGVANVSSDGSLRMCCAKESDLDNHFLDNFEEADENWQPKAKIFTFKELQTSAPLGLYDEYNAQQGRVPGFVVAQAAGENRIVGLVSGAVANPAAWQNTKFILRKKCVVNAHLKYSGLTF